jgi:zinc/manganese transport system substrate-binding protein
MDQLRDVRRRSLLASMACTPAILGCPRRLQAHDQFAVVVTFSILRDLASTIAGAQIEVTALVGPDADTHSYQGKPLDVQRVAQASLLVSNGMGFEQWLPRVLGAARFAGRHVVASDGVTPLMRAAIPGSPKLMLDPHCWNDVSNTRRYVANILSGLASVDAPNADAHRMRASAFDDRLVTLDQWVRRQIGRVPAEKRRVITSHDAFGYFARAYGVEFLSVRGLNAEQEPSARDVAALIGLVRKQRIRALFFENLGNPTQIEQIARDSGGIIGQELYPDALSMPNGPAPTYEALMRHNVTALVDGMLQN